MTPPTLNSLPFPVILELCSHLDLIDLVSMSQVSRSLLTVSKLFKSYWLPALVREELVLPLPSHLPLVTFSGEQLRAATVVALKRERNLDEIPRLRSQVHIPWPYSRSPSCNKSEMPASTVGETPSEAIWMHLTHPNGQWLFIVSKKNVIRILHLPSGTLVWEEWNNVMPVMIEETIPYICFAVDFMGDEYARVAMVIMVADGQVALILDDLTLRRLTRNLETPEYTREGELEQNLHPYMRIVDVKFDSANTSICMTEFARYPLSWRPSHLDIAGDHIAFVDAALPESEHGEAPVYLMNWRTGSRIELPKLLPSTQVSTFQDYLVSMGISDDTVVIQVISFPRRTHESGSSNAATSTTPSSSEGYKLVASIQLPTPKDVTLSPLHAGICHNYKGDTPNHFRIWIRDRLVNNWSPCWSVYEIPVDFSRPTSEWFSSRPLSKNASPYQRLLDEYSITHRQVFERASLTRWIVTVGHGKRFFWWSGGELERDDAQESQVAGRSLDTTAVADDSGQVQAMQDESVYKREFFLSTSTISECEPVSELDYLLELLDIYSYTEERSMDYLERPMETRIMETLTPEGESNLYALDCEEASGVVIIIWRTGNIDLLRYM